MGDYVSTYSLLRAFLASIGQTSVFRRPPSNLTLVVPVLVVARIGGNDRTITLDQPRVAIDAYASDEDAAEVLGETVRTAMRTKARGFMHGGAVIGDVATFSGPQLLPWNAPNVFKVGSSYQLVVHQYGGVG
jgi:hypothetical protein